MKILEKLSKRKTIILKEPILKKLGVDPEIGIRGIDSDIERMKQEKISEWRKKGYREGLINMAIELAEDWAYKMSEVFAPPEFRSAAVKYNFPKALEVADRWIRVIGEAAKGSS